MAKGTINRKAFVLVEGCDVQKGLCLQPSHDLKPRINFTRVQGSMVETACGRVRLTTPRLVYSPFAYDPAKERARTPPFESLASTKPCPYQRPASKTNNSKQSTAHRDSEVDAEVVLPNTDGARVYGPTGWPNPAKGAPRVLGARPCDSPICPKRPVLDDGVVAGAG